MLDPKLSLRGVYVYKKTDLRDKQCGVHRIDHENIYEGIRSRHSIKQSHGVRMKPFSIPLEPGFGYLEKPAKNNSDKYISQKAQAEGDI